MSQKFIDQAKELRESDGFDVTAFNQWLQTQVPGLTGTPKVKQFSGGASNLTYQLSYPEQSNGQPIDYIMRRPPSGHKAATAHDMKREHNVMKALKPVFPYVPEMIAICDDHTVIGGDFYVMERVVGIIPRGNMPKGMTLSRRQARDLCVSAFDKLIDLHKVDYKAAGLGNLGKGEGYVQRQVDGWSSRYVKSKTWNVPAFKKVIKWLKENQPKDIDVCIIHNDFRLDNLILNPDNHEEIIGVLDWEMCTLGDPMMDLGGALAYWVEEDDDFVMKGVRRQPSHLPGMLTRDQIVDYYCEKMGFDKSLWPFYEVFGLFRLAAIAQQIYYRYHHKQTDNPAFKNFWIMVNYLNLRCRRIINEANLPQK